MKRLISLISMALVVAAIALSGEAAGPFDQKLTAERQIAHVLSRMTFGARPGDSADVQGGLFDQLMAQHLAAAGGVGLAAAFVRQMQPPAGAARPDTNAPTAPVPGPPPARLPPG